MFARMLIGVGVCDQDQERGQIYELRSHFPELGVVHIVCCETEFLRWNCNSEFSLFFPVFAVSLDRVKMLNLRHFPFFFVVRLYRDQAAQTRRFLLRRRQRPAAGRAV